MDIPLKALVEVFKHEIDAACAAVPSLSREEATTAILAACHLQSCQALKSNMGDSDPQDCDWPFCGCDGHAARVIDTLSEQGHIHSWTSIRDEIPPAGRYVLVATTTGKLAIARPEDSIGLWWTLETTNCGITNVTHWCPLPALPEPLFSEGKL